MFAVSHICYAIDSSRNTKERKPADQISPQNKISTLDRVFTIFSHLQYKRAFYTRNI